MIRIDVEDYCDSCLDFSADVIKPQRCFSIDGEIEMRSDTIIQCEHRKRCAGIKRYLEQQMKGVTKNE
jgi:hypothetical protein